VKNISAISRLIYKYLPAILIIALAFFYIWITARYMGYRLPISPDESQALFFSEKLAVDHTLVVHNPLNEQFSEKIFASRQYIQRGASTMPSAFLGYILFLGFLQTIHHSFIFLAGPLLAAGCLTFVYLIAKNVFSKEVGIFAIILLGSFPVFVYWVASYYNDLGELFFILMILLCLIKLSQNESMKYYILLSLSVAGAIWMRYTGLILIPICLLIYAMLYRKKISVPKALLSFVIVIIFLLPLLYVNNQLYGSPLTYGQKSKDQLVYALEDSNLPKEILPFVPFRSTTAFLKNSSSYLFLLSPLLFIFSILGAVAAYKKMPEKRKFIIILLSFCIIWIAYYMGGIYFGYGNEPTLNASYTRYLLVVYSILLILFSYFIHLINSLKLKATLVAVSLLVGANLTIAGLTGLKAQAESSLRWRTAIIKATPPNSILFVKGADKILYPSRNTALYIMLSKNKEKTTGISQTIKLMRQAKDKGYHVYIFNEDNFYPGHKIYDYISKLNTHGLKVVNNNQELGFEEIGYQ
jgi:4-amino-4-deoxy-L-arabinose transferase-like glycosyltransferase